MNVKETKTKKQLIDMAVQISSCTDDDAAMQAIELIMNPVNDRVKMGDAYEQTLGYNPLRAFDEDDIGILIDDVSLEASPTLISALQGAKNDLIKKAIGINELRRDSHLRDALAEAATLVLDAEMASELQTILLGASEPDDGDADDETVDEEEEDDVEDDEDDGVEFSTF